MKVSVYALEDGRMDVLVQATPGKGRAPVVVQDGPGFLVNRLLSFYTSEAMWLLDEGLLMLRVTCSDGGREVVRGGITAWPRSGGRAAAKCLRGQQRRPSMPVGAALAPKRHGRRHIILQAPATGGA